MKKCAECNNLKPLTEFYKNKRYLDGYKNQCKTCASNYKQLQRRTIKGLCYKIYDGQLTSSKRRGHVLPLYSKQELMDWITSQSNFNTLYSSWVESDYNKDLIPSVDRLDDSKGYSLDNIRLVTWFENNTKQHKISETSDRCKPIVALKGCMQWLFKSIAEASRETNTPNANIYKCLKGEYKIANGYKFKRPIGVA